VHEIITNPRRFLAFSTYKAAKTFPLPLLHRSSTLVTGGEVNGLLRVGEAHFMPWKKREFKWAPLRRGVYMIKSRP